MQYRYEATSEIGFVQQLACNYLPHGYWFYVQGWIPEGKQPRDIDSKLLRKYGIAVSRQTRSRRKKKGLANLHYLRFDRVFVLLATRGEHSFFREEEFRDVRKTPIRFAGYSISSKQGNYLQKQNGAEKAQTDYRYRSRVQVARPVYLDWHAYFADAARHCGAERLSRELYNFPYEPYAPVRKQLLELVSLVNRVRKERGRSSLDPRKVARFRRRIVKPFELHDMVRGMVATTLAA